MFMKRRGVTAVSFLAVLLAMTHSYGQNTPTPPGNSPRPISIPWPPPTDIITQPIGGPTDGAALFLPRTGNIQFTVQPGSQFGRTPQVVTIQLAEMRLETEALERTRLIPVTDGVRVSQKQLTLTPNGKAQSFTLTTGLRTGSHYYLLALSDKSKPSIREVRLLYVP